jgi:3,5-epimerase/4-reductase
MIWLIYGSKGWIGTQIKEILIKQGHTVVDGLVRADNYTELFGEIHQVGPDRIISVLGRTSGKECSNIDYLELPGKLVENLRDNLQAPLNLAVISNSLHIHLMYVGTGCIFSYNDTHPLNSTVGFTEDDLPNFTGSQYSAVKGTTDQLIRRFDNVLNCRIRMPLSDQINQRNFITKITNYKKVISIPNSMTVLPELLPIMIDMAKNKNVGTINMTNPGSISHQEILDMYQQYVDPTFIYTVMSLEELSKYATAGRSNNYLDTSLLTSKYNVTEIKEAVRKLLINMGQNKAHPTTLI